VRNKKKREKASSRPEHWDHMANPPTQIAAHKNDRIKTMSGAAITTTSSDRATIFRRQALVRPSGPAGLIHNGKGGVFFFGMAGFACTGGYGTELGRLWGAQMTDSFFSVSSF